MREGKEATLPAESNTEAHEIETVLSRNSHRMFAAGLAPVELDWARRAELTTWSQWCAYWTVRADAYGALGESSVASDHLASAGDYYFAAAICAHFAQFMIFEDGPTKNDAADLSAKYFHLAAPYLRPKVTIEYADSGDPQVPPLPVALSLPGGPGPFPCVILVPGLEANKIEVQGYQRYFTDRGIAFAAMEGPGQGELHGTPLTMPRYQAAVSAVFDHLERLPQIDGGRIGLCGVSLGGLLGSLAVAHEPRFTAACEVSGTFDTESRWPQATWISRRGSRYITRSESDEATFDLVRTWTLLGEAHRITCPFLVIHGDQDPMIPVTQVDMYREHLPQAEVFVIKDGNHVCNNQFQLVRPMIGDWFAEQLGSEATT